MFRDGPHRKSTYGIRLSQPTCLYGIKATEYIVYHFCSELYFLLKLYVN